MIARVKFNNQHYSIDLSSPLDISLPVKQGGVKAWYVNEPTFEPVRMGEWVGDVNQGGSVNFRDIYFNPHGHGTHTECVGHISKENYSINQCINDFHFFAQLITVQPEQINDDVVIRKTSLKELKKLQDLAAVIIRTDIGKLKIPETNFTNTNPPYLNQEAVEFILNNGFNHILIDTPSVDREVDGGKLTAHHLIWDYPLNTNLNRTITELVYIPESITDGIYFMNLQVAAFENDAAPSRPVLFRLQETN